MAGYLDQFADAEAFVRRQITANLGTDNVIMKDDLIKLAEEHGIKLEKNMTKDQIYLKLREHLNIEKILALCEHVGVSSKDIQERFGIEHKDVKKLEKSGFLKVSGKMRFRIYGKYMDAPLYDPFQFFSLTVEEIQAELGKLGKKKQKTARLIGRSYGRSDPKGRSNHHKHGTDDDRERKVLSLLSRAFLFLKGHKF